MATSERSDRAYVVSQSLLNPPVLRTSRIIFPPTSSIGSSTPEKPSTIASTVFIIVAS